MKSFGVMVSALLSAGLLVLFIAERILGEGTAHDVTLGLSLLMLLAALALRLVAFQRAQGDAQRIERILLGAYGAVAAALLLYALSTDWGVDMMGLSGSAAERTAGSLGALWPAVLIVAFPTLWFTEFAYRSMPVAEAVELRRARVASYSGLGIGFALVFLGASNYVANAKNVKEDVSYFKTTEPSDSTLKMVERLGEPVRVILFFPKVNEVYEEVKPYFDSLDKRSKKLKVTVKDHALEPELARKHRVRSNGFVVLLKGEGKGQQSENFEIGTKVEEARDRLKKLDGNFQKVFTKLTTVRREIHVTTGHRERSAGGADGDSPPERTAQLKVALERSNIKTRDLGLSQGLAQQVPAGAPAVAVIGPRTAFLVEEARSLLRYVQEGGRLIVMVDPDVEHGLDPLLHGLGLALQPGVIASTRSHLRRTQSNADRGIVFSATYSAHPTVTTASRNAGRVATIFYNGGHLGRHQGEGALSGLNVVFPLRSDPAFWRDLNGDFEQSAEEKSEAMNMMAAVTVKGKGGKEGRAVVIADGDFVTDQLIRNPGNILVLGDILQWLLGQEQIVGEASSEEDVRIEHTRDEDKLWFYATSFGVPVPVLALGVWMAMRRRRRKESK